MSATGRGGVISAVAQPTSNGLRLAGRRGRDFADRAAEERGALGHLGAVVLPVVFVFDGEDGGFDPQPMDLPQHRSQHRLARSPTGHRGRRD